MMDASLENIFRILADIGHTFVGLSLFMLLLYMIRLKSFKSRTKKYTFVSKRERPVLTGSAILFSCSTALYSFLIIELTIGLNGAHYFWIASILSIGVALAVGYSLYVYFSYYHPFILEKRLKDIRFAPMISPRSGKPMTLLNEAQEDKFMSKEMIEEEEASTIDYDVWIDKDSDYKVIERYDTRFDPEVCSSCNFRTLMERRSEVIKKPQLHEQGLLRKSYECTYCRHIESRDVTLSSLDKEAEYESYEKDILDIPTGKMTST
ncbi:MAG: hypothetical protein RIC06_01030 [Cyclobacteriaceae bacterium]